MPRGIENNTYAQFWGDKKEFFGNFESGLFFVGGSLYFFLLTFFFLGGGGGGETFFSKLVFGGRTVNGRKNPCTTGTHDISTKLCA